MTPEPDPTAAADAPDADAPVAAVDAAVPADEPESSAGAPTADTSAEAAADEEFPEDWLEDEGDTTRELMPDIDAADDPFAFPRYRFRTKMMKLVGEGFLIKTWEGRPAMYAELRSLTMRDHLRVWRGHSRTDLLLDIRAQNHVDAWCTFAVTDARDGSTVGYLRRRAWRSILRDTWWILDAERTRIGDIRERSAGMAIWRRLTSNMWPQSFDADIGKAPAATIRSHTSVLTWKWSVDFTCNREKQLDPRLGIAAAVLLCLYELRDD